MAMLINGLIFTLAIIITAYLLPGVTLSGLLPAVLTAIVLALVNAFLTPVLMSLGAPITAMTLGLFAFVINALMIMLVSAVVPGFKVNGFWWAILFSLVLSIVTAILFMVF